MNEHKNNVDYTDILKDRKEKGLLSQIVDKITPIKPTVKNDEYEDYQSLISSIFDD